MPINRRLPPNALFVLPDKDIRLRSVYVAQIFEPAQHLHREFGGKTKWLPQLTRIYDHADRIFWPGGTPFHVPHVDDIFPDPQMRWMSYFLRRGVDGGPKHVCKTFERLRLIALLVRIMAEEQPTIFPENVLTALRPSPGADEAA